MHTQQVSKHNTTQQQQQQQQETILKNAFKTQHGTPSWCLESSTLRQAWDEHCFAGKQPNGNAPG